HRHKGPQHRVTGELLETAPERRQRIGVAAQHPVGASEADKRIVAVLLRQPRPAQRRLIERHRLGLQAETVMDGRGLVGDLDVVRVARRQVQQRKPSSLVRTGLARARLQRQRRRQIRITLFTRISHRGIVHDYRRSRHTPGMVEEDQETPERHASWIELFFDLVVVAGVAQLAHLLSHGPSLGDVGLYLLVFLAFWISWASFTVYGNVEGDRVRIPAMLLAMLGLAVMVAAVPGIRDQHTTAFVVAYVGLRWLAGAIYQRGQVVVDWPLAQYGGG